jgi:cold shock protein
VPAGKVKWYDTDKGFGFLTKDEGGDVYVRAAALPAGVTALKAGQRVEFGIVAGRKGDQALSVRLLEAPPSVAKAMRKTPDEMIMIVEDLIKLLDGLETTYRRNRHPESRTSKQVSTVLRALANELES